MYRSILVPLDGSVFSEHALPLALNIARRANAALQLVHVHTAAIPLYDANGLPGLDNHMDADAQEHEHAYLTDLAQRLAATWNVTVTTTLLDGEESVDELLRQHAAASGADLIVMTTHGRSGVLRMCLGSVADKLVRWASMPVLLVRPQMEAPERFDLNREQDVTQIMISLDGSAMAEHSLAPAMALGSVMQAEYTVLQAITPVVANDATDELVKEQDGHALAQWQDDTRAYLEQVAERLRAQGAVVQTSVVIGPAAESILAYARQHPVDLIALTTHGRTGLPRMLVGSVAMQVLCHATVPILLVGPGMLAAEPSSQEPHASVADHIR
jgi:nucleotide-binding universal stress UspA family protein